MCGITVSIALKRGSPPTTNGNTTNGTKTHGANLNGATSTQEEARASLEAALAKSLDKIAHRGPDAQGIWISNDNSVGTESFTFPFPSCTKPQTHQTKGLAHNRLATNDLSSSGTQPIHSPCQKIHAAVNGEIYDHD